MADVGNVRAVLYLELEREDGTTVETVPVTDAMLDALRDYLIAVDNYSGPWSSIETPLVYVGWAVVRALGLREPARGEASREPAAPRLVQSRRALSKAQCVRIMVRDGGKCVKCSATEDLTIDHIVPVSKGGSDEDDNLRTLCRSCNSTKGARVES